MSLVQRTTDFLKEVRVEMPKVSWPTRTELRAATFVVIVMTLIMAVIVYAFDKVYVFGLERLFRAG
jgi:preprotein translocase subunit SecE